MQVISDFTKSARVCALLLVGLFMWGESGQTLAAEWSSVGSRIQDYDIGGDPTAPHGSENGAYIKSNVSQINGWGGYAIQVNADEYSGNGLKVSAFVKAVNVTASCRLFMEVTENGTQLAYDTMLDRQITGDTDWKRYEVILDVPESATNISYGMFMRGTGEMYIDGLALESAARSWEPVNSSVPEYITSLAAVNGSAVWAGAHGGNFMRSTDGGDTWESGPVTGASNYTFWTITAIDDKTAFVAGHTAKPRTGRIYKTIDGGATWTVKYENDSDGLFFNSIAFWDAKSGLAVADKSNGTFMILKTSNGGDEWTPVPAENIPDPLPGEAAGVADAGGRTLAVQGKNRAWFGTSHYSENGQPTRVFKTIDGGLHWTVVNTPLLSEGDFRGVTTIAFKDEMNGFVGSAGGYTLGDALSNTLAKTTDGGETWSIVSSYPPHNPANIIFVPNTDDKIIFTSTLQGACYSMDGGETWNELASTEPSYAATFLGANSGWAAMKSGQLVKLVVDLSSTRVAENRPAEKPDNYFMAQNYPNPFNPQTTIEFQVPEEADIKLSVFDLLGQETEILLENRLSPGRYSVVFESGQLPSGYYFYRLFQNGQQVAARTMTLLK